MITRENKNAIIAFILSICLVSIIGYLIITFVHDNLDVEYIESISILDVSYFVAEKSETIAYAAIITTFPLAFIFFFKLLNKTKFDIDLKTLKIELALGVLAILFLAISLIFKWEGYSVETVAIDNIVIFIISIIACILATIAYQKLSKSGKNKIFKTILYIIGISIILVISYTFINNSYSKIIFLCIKE